ncbi:zinc metalloprotease [Pyxidicoccus xibeiensis]|uniref:hypothetical protein n=1 Tax=Pyxidicoccus xibeiensis TaxID=2906759 RepID=UPI0020A7B972|nr:hypothetical protein [Pyxidicoccus xibeiensis]MCP3142971.1 hypothetical protein [Pyxidicoccus xibeiensis]
MNRICLLALYAVLWAGCGSSNEEAPRLSQNFTRLTDETWYGAYTMLREEWEDSFWSETSPGCVSFSSSETSYRDMLLHDIVSDDTGARFAASRKRTSRSVYKRTSLCDGCTDTTTDIGLASGSGVVEADIDVGIDFDEGVSVLMVTPWDTILEQSSHTTTYESTCSGPEEQGMSGEADIVAAIDEIGYWLPGATPGSYIIYGSRVETSSSGDHHWRDTYTWRFSNKQEVRLVIDAVNLENWRPLATYWDGSGAPPTTGGAHLKLEAILVPLPSSTSAPLPKARKITFKLLKSSSVPGIAMNAPLYNAENSPQDLQFEQARNQALGMVFVNKDRVETAPGSLYEFASAELSSFDSGAYGEVTAEAELEDGTIITARFRDTGDNPMRIPKRAPDSYVAEKWMQDHGAGAAGDFVDEEKLAGGAGDGHFGDGLTMYEEYRGFFANNIWFDTRPAEVDLMVLNDTSESLKADIDSGIQRFATASGLKVHSAFTRQDLETPMDHTDYDATKRVINLNTLEEGGRHKVDQHAVVLRLSSNALSPISQTYGGPSSPKNISQIELSRRATGDKLVWTVAHELGHAVNIPHHGEGGIRDAYWALRPDGSFHETADSTTTTGVPVILKLEATGQVFSSSVSTEVTLSTKLQGLASGDETCFMRYPIATGIERASEPGVRYYILSPEPYGVTLCLDGMGKDFNSNRTYPDGSPRPSRHGNAAAGRGNCMHRTCINDFHAHPSGGTP